MRRVREPGARRGHSVVIGRHWTSHSSRPSKQNSTSTGLPKPRSARAHELRHRREASSSRSVRIDPTASRADAIGATPSSGPASPGRRRRRRRRRARTRRRRSSSPLTGSRENATPARVACTSRWITTAIAPRAPYASARSVEPAGRERLRREAVPVDAEHGLVLPGERALGRVLADRGRAHGERLAESTRRRRRPRRSPRRPARPRQAGPAARARRAARDPRPCRRPLERHGAELDDHQDGSFAPALEPLDGAPAPPRA